MNITKSLILTLCAAFTMTAQAEEMPFEAAPSADDPSERGTWVLFNVLIIS